jgi:hypothetical protein
MLIGLVFLNSTILICQSQINKNETNTTTPISILKVPAGFFASAKVAMTPDEVAPGVPYDLVVEATTPFGNQNGDRVGPSNIRFLLKLAKGNRTVIVTEANWTKLNPFEMYSGKANAHITVNIETDGSILKSKNRDLIIYLDSDLILTKFTDFKKQLFEYALNKAKSGDVGNMNQVGFYYQYGIGVDVDEDLSMEWYKKSAKLGNTEAMSALGHMYYNKKNYGEAKTWFEHASLLLYGHADYMLAILYYNGNGVNKDLDKVINYLKEGASLENPESMNMLSLAYFNGEGVPKDELQAYVWSNLAASKNKQYAKTRDIIEQKLSPEQRQEGQRIARDLFNKLQQQRIVK